MQKAEDMNNSSWFLVNFIMGNYLGPDLYFDNPRCSAFQRLSLQFPLYTSNNLGTSFLTISQLESLYYYVLRNARPSLILKPNVLYMYLKGELNFGKTELYRQFTGIFPLNIHEHKKYSSSYEIVKGLVLIDDPVTFYMNKEDLERFKLLSCMDALKIDSKECLSYQYLYLNGGLETKQHCVMDSDEISAGIISNQNETSSAMFGKTYRRRKCGSSMPAISSGEGKEECFKGSNLDETAPTPVLAPPNLDACVSRESTILTGTASKGRAGPPVGVVDIGINDAAYFFQVALPGVRRDFCEVSCEIESDGKVHIQGSTAGGKIIKKRSRDFHMKTQNLCPPGPFTVSFDLPGPVDPRLFSPYFRDDGIFEAVIVKHKQK